MNKILFLVIMLLSCFSFAIKTDCQNLKNDLTNLKSKQNFLNQDLTKNMKQLEANQSFLNTYNKDCRSQKSLNKNSNCNPAMYSMISAQMPTLTVQQYQMKQQMAENKIIQDQSTKIFKNCSKK